MRSAAIRTDVPRPSSSWAWAHSLQKNGNLEIDMSSKILEVADCFPITIGKDENVVSAIGIALNLAG